MRKFTLLLLLAVFIAGTSVTANATSLYIVGNVSDTGNSWSTDLGGEMTETSDNVFEITTTIYSYFAFVTGDGINSDSDWDTYNANRYGPATNGTTPTLGEATSINFGYGTSFYLSSGEYYVVVDLNALTLTVTAVESELPTTMYVIGDVNSCGWSASAGVEMTSSSDGVYTATCTIDDNNGGAGISSLSYVAFASELGSSDDDEGWTTTNANRYGPTSYNYVPVPSTSVTITKSDSYSYGVAPGDYTIEVDLNNNTVTFTPTGTIDYDYPDVLYFIGGIDGASWDTTESSAVSVSEDTDTPGLYTAEITVAADAYFGIGATVTDETDWTTFNAYRYVPSSSSTLTTGGSCDMVMNGDASFYIADAGTYTCTIQLTSLSSGTVTISIPAETASITSAGYATYVTESDVSFPEEITAYAVKVDDGNASVTLTAIDAAPAGTAVLLEGAEGEYELTAESETPDAVDTDLTSSTTDVDADGTQYVLANGNSGVGFYLVTTGTTISAGKGYLVISGTAAKSFIGFGEATGISNVAVEAETAGGAIYNIAGQQVAESYKGVVVKNGKKYINK